MLDGIKSRLIRGEIMAKHPRIEKKWDAVKKIIQSWPNKKKGKIMKCPKCGIRLESLILEEKTLTVFEVKLKQGGGGLYRQGASVVKNTAIRQTEYKDSLP